MINLEISDLVHTIGDTLRLGTLPHHVHSTLPWLSRMFLPSLCPEPLLKSSVLGFPLCGRFPEMG